MRSILKNNQLKFNESKNLQAILTELEKSPVKKHSIIPLTSKPKLTYWIGGGNDCGGFAAASFASNSETRARKATSISDGPLETVGGVAVTRAVEEEGTAVVAVARAVGVVVGGGCARGVDKERGNGGDVCCATGFHLLLLAQSGRGVSPKRGSGG